MDKTLEQGFALRRENVMFGADRPQKHQLVDMDGLPLPPRAQPPDWVAIDKYERQMQAAFDAEAEHRDCCCDNEVNPFCKTHSS